MDQAGPFYDTNKQFDKALEDRIFDSEMEGVKMKVSTCMYVYIYVCVHVCV